MKKIISIIVFFLMAAMPSWSQSNLWASGSAVPGGKQKLVKRPDGLFRFAGALNAGEVKIMTTENYEAGVTRYLIPQLTDSYIINRGLRYVQTADSSRAGWQVLFQEDTYRFMVNTSDQTVTGELMLPWNEVLIAGSAFPGGSDNVEWKRDNMLPFVRDHQDPYVFTWTGELGTYENTVEPGHFKLEGQMTWGPRELHPYTDNEDLLETTQVNGTGPDRKWQVRTPGTYRITVNLFYETFHAELLSDAVRGNSTGIDQLSAHEGHSQDGPAMSTQGASPCVYDLQGRVQKTLQRGLNIVRRSDGTMRKVYHRR